ncbi:MAG: glutathione S-transferase N-terminal domain-containing protein [Nanoarchaeota archaeon]|nr:glutathione S-transferase N-terminal domain-containing protein [Nanoarchaeota archaeon]
MKKVKVYSTPTCHWCHKTKAFLTEKGIEFLDVNLASDPAAMNEVISKTGQMGVPVIEIDGTIIIGFNQSAIEGALA